MSDLNDKLASLQQRLLERDDESDPNGRIYRDKVSGEIYHSVTRILGATAPEEQQKALAKWLERPDSTQTRDMAAARGTAAHNSAEYVLKTAQRLARATAQNATAGAYQKMAFIEHQKQSQNGPWKKPFKAPRVSPGALVVSLGVCGDGSWTT